MSPEFNAQYNFMEITWLGAAGFKIKCPEAEILFDPFLSRGRAQPSPFNARSFGNAQALLVGHGHFDHTYDIPAIAKNSDVKIFASGLTKALLHLRGVTANQLITAHQNTLLFAPLKVQAFKSAHARFDWPLIKSTLKRCSIKDALHICNVGLSYPQGLVQTYLFEHKNKKFLFISSAGCTQNELKKYRDLEVDVLLAPLQGHSQIQKLVAEQTLQIHPKIVIPHHHDDFYPPLSQTISVEEYRDQLKFLGFKGDVLELPLFDSSVV